MRFLQPFIQPFIVVALLVGTAAQARGQTTAIPASVVNVVDGVTFDLQLEDGSMERVRLIGVDAPELGQCFGAEALGQVQLLVGTQPVQLEADPSQGARDQFGRLLAHVWLPDGRNLGEALLAEGFVRGTALEQPHAYADAFTAAQQLATSSGMGLWAPTACSPATPTSTTVPAAPKPAATTPVLPVPASLRFDPFGPDRDCGDFRTHAEAQAFFRAAGGPGSDPHRLDADRDGIACETLP